MAVKKIQIKPPDSNYADVLHPETDSTMVLMGDGTTLETALAGKAASNHNHDGTYEPADSNIMKKNVATTMTARLIGQNNTEYTTSQVRNVRYYADGATIPTAANGEIIIIYEP